MFIEAFFVDGFWKALFWHGDTDGDGASGPSGGESRVLFAIRRRNRSK